MKRILLQFFVIISVLGLKAQDGLRFKPEIDVDFKDIDEIQVPESPIKTQVLFSEEKDTVTYVDNYGKPAGFENARGGHDFIGITPDGDDYWISVNHETRNINPKLGNGGGMTSFKVSRATDGTFEVKESTLGDGRKGYFHSVDFVNTVGETWTNCGGIIAPDGRIWTAEEYPLMESWGQGNKYLGFTKDTGDVTIGEGYLLPFVNDSSQLFSGEKIKRFENQGWMVEIDPKTAKAIRKQYNWGRMSFEAGAIADDMKTVYLAEDERPGLFTKFVADKAGDFTKGKLYVYKQDNAGSNWLEVPDDKINDMVNFKDWAWSSGATFFIRLEWVTIINDKVYIAETGYDNVAKKSSWQNAIKAGSIDQVAYHHVERAKTQKHVDSDGNESTGVKTQFVDNDTTHYYDYYGRILEYDPATDTVKPYLEGGPHFGTKTSQKIANYPAKHLSNPDGIGKITIGGTDYLIINEDLNGSSYNRIPSDGNKLCEMFLLDMDNINNPTVDDLIRIYVGPNGSELTGGNGTSDGKTILVNIQHPNGANDAPYNNASTIALTGWDQLAKIADANFNIDFSKGAKAQATPVAGVFEQVIFSGDVDTVAYVDTYGKFAGFTPARQGHDFVGITKDGDDYWLSVNHETRNSNLMLGDGGGMTTFKVTRGNKDSLKVVATKIADTTCYFHSVDFVNTVGETWTNCGGIIAPDGRIWTAEEYPRMGSWGQGNKDVMSFLSDTGDVIIGEGIMVPFRNDASQMFKGEKLKRFESQGWMVEIDPKTGKAIRKQYNWGRMSFEAGAIMPDMKTVYLAEDERPGLFTKFVADKKGDFTKGKLYVYNQNGKSSKWMEVPGDLETLKNMKDWAWKNGATYFIRLEWVTEINGKVYIAETGYDNVCKKSTWNKAISDGSVTQVAKHHQDRAKAQSTSLDTVGNSDAPYYDYYGRILEYDPATEEIKPYLEGGPDYAEKTSQNIADYPSKHLSNPDGIGKIKINNKHYMIINEDLNGSSYNRLPADGKGWTCEMYLLDMTIANPTVADLTRIMVGPDGAELTGGNGTPDGKTILVNIQHPSSDNTAPYNKAVTVALSGFDHVSSIKENTNDNAGFFNVYPNPATRYLNFNNVYSVAIYNASGKLVKTKENSTGINISDLEHGIYFIQNSEGVVKKLIIE